MQYNNVLIRDYILIHGDPIVCRFLRELYTLCFFFFKYSPIRRVLFCGDFDSESFFFHSVYRCWCIIWRELLIYIYIYTSEEDSFLFFFFFFHLIPRKGAAYIIFNGLRATRVRKLLHFCFTFPRGIIGIHAHTHIYIDINSRKFFSPKDVLVIHSTLRFSFPRYMPQNLEKKTWSSSLHRQQQWSQLLRAHMRA